MFDGLTEEDTRQLAEMLVILSVATVIIIFVNFVILPKAFSALLTVFKSAPVPRSTYKPTHIIRYIIFGLLWGVLYFVVREIVDRDFADIVWLGSLYGIGFIVAWHIYHDIFMPFWLSLPSAFTIHFSTSALGYQPFRKLTFTQKGQIAVWIISIVAASVLLGRMSGFIDPNQPIMFSVPMVEYVNDFRYTISNFNPLDQIDSAAQKTHLLSLAEVLVTLMVYAIALLFFVLPITNRIMRLIPAFTIKLTFIDHIGIFLACAIGIGLGYLPALL